MTTKRLTVDQLRRAVTMRKAGMSFAQIGLNLGFSKQAISRHFRSKTSLLTAKFDNIKVEE